MEITTRVFRAKIRNALSLARWDQWRTPILAFLSAARSTMIVMKLMDATRAPGEETGVFLAMLVGLKRTHAICAMLLSVSVFQSCLRHRVASRARQIFFPVLLRKSSLKRWLMGTHAGAVRRKHLQAYLDEFAFRHNRRKTNGIVRVAARVIESVVATPPLTMRNLIDQTRPCRRFASHQTTPA